MRICFVANPESIHTRRWVQAFVRFGHDVHLISTTAHPARHDWAPDEAPEMHEAAYPRRGLVRDTLRTLVRFRSDTDRLRNLIRAISPDVLHVHYLNEAAVHTVAAAGSVPVVFTAWGSDILISPRRNVARRIGARWALRRFAAITCDAPHMVDAMVRMGAAPDRCFVVPFGVDLSLFNPDKTDSSFAGTLPRPEAPSVISIRSLEPIYDIPTLVRAVRILVDRGTNVNCLIAGGGSLETELRRLSHDLDLDDRISFLGRVGQAELPRLFASSDVYVSTALSDAGLASSTIEAMACGTYAIVTDVADNREWVRTGETGRLVPPGDPAALAAAIDAALADREARARIASAGRAAIAAGFGLDECMRRVENLLERVVRRQGPAVDEPDRTDAETRQPMPTTDRPLEHAR